MSTQSGNHTKLLLAAFCHMRVFALISFAISLGGCEGMMDPLRKIDIAQSDITVASLKGDALVYGRIRWIENGKVRSKYKHAYGWNIWPQFLRLDDMEEGALSVEDDGTFTWKLPRGDYIFHQIYWFDSWDGRHRFTPKVAFHIPNGANAYCLGTFVINLKGKRDLIGGLWVKSVKIHIKDDCVSLDDQFRSRYRDPDLKIAKSLMIFDQHMPDRPNSLKEKDELQDFIRAITPGLMTIH